MPEARRAAVNTANCERRYCAALFHLPTDLGWAHQWTLACAVVAASIFTPRQYTRRSSPISILMPSGVVARVEASASHAEDMLRNGLDIRYVVTSPKQGDART